MSYEIQRRNLTVQVYDQAGIVNRAAEIIGSAIGTTVQAYDDGLASIAGLTTAANKMIYTTAADTYAVTDLTAAGRALIDDADASAQRTTLGLGALAVLSDIGTAQINAAAYASLAEAQAGTENTKIMTALRVKDAQANVILTRCIGWGQTWTDVLASRTFNTSYLNNTQRPIQVIARGGSSIATLQASADNSTWIDLCQIGGSQFHFSNAIIPNGWYYRVNGTITLTGWVELR